MSRLAKVGHSLVEAFAACLIVFACVFVYEFFEKAKDYWHPYMSLTTPPIAMLEGNQPVLPKPKIRSENQKTFGERNPAELAVVLSCESVILPATISPGEELHVWVLLQHGGSMSSPEAWSPTDEFRLWPISWEYLRGINLGKKCSVTNYSGKMIANVVWGMTVNFRTLIKRDGSETVSEIVDKETRTMRIKSLDASPLPNRYTFYLENEARDLAAEVMLSESFKAEFSTPLGNPTDVKVKFLDSADKQIIIYPYVWTKQQ